MASSVALSQLRLDARLYADQRPGSSTSFISDTELTRLVNLKARELYDMLVEARGLDYYTTNSTFLVTGGTSSYDLPDDFYELESLTFEWGTRDHEVIDPVPTNRSRAWYANYGVWSRYSPKGYRLTNTQVDFLPTPAGSVTCRIRYVPAFTDMVDDADTFDGINGWEKMIAIGVAIEMREIEKRPSATLANMYAEQLARIMSLKDERDAEGVKTIIDVRPEGGRGRRLPVFGVFDDSFDRSFD